MRVRAVVLAAVLVLAPLGARAADLVVWWEEGYNPEEDHAVEEIVAAFEKKTGTDVELVLQPQEDLPTRAAAAVKAGRPPDLVSGLIGISYYYPQWAYEGRLADLSHAIGPLIAKFDQEVLDRATVLDATVGRRSLYVLPTGRTTIHVHVWKSLLERAGFTLGDVPKEWEPFWSFWCDQVQPAVRKALGRDDIWAVGAPMSIRPTDTRRALRQFVHAYTEAWPTPDGPNLLRDPTARTVLIKGLEAYTAIWRKGCTPPDAVDWTNRDNNEAFLKQRVVMTMNNTLSIPRALKHERPDDYYRNAITINWPKDTFGQPEHIHGTYTQAVVFKDGGHTAAAEELVRFLVGDGWLAQYVMSVGDRLLPPSRQMLDQPFWLDPSDPHRLQAAIQAATQPHVQSVYGLDWEQENRLERESEFTGLGAAVHRVVVDGLTPEQAADEAIARIKQILSE